MKESVRSTRWLLMLAASALAVLGGQAAQSPAASKPPVAAKRPVADTYHGIKVVDDYRWLENWDDPAVKAWSGEQNARTRAYLDGLASRPAIKQRLEELIGASAGYFSLRYRAGTLFAMKFDPAKQQPFLVAMPSADAAATARVVVDPNAASDKGSISIQFYVPSLDGKLVAAALTENGSEDSAARVFETATGRELGDRVPRVNFATAGGSIAWNHDGSGFYYTRYPQGHERPADDANFYQQVYFHRLGTDNTADTYVIGKDFPRIAEIQLATSDDGRWLLASVANGDGGEFAHYLMDAGGRWTQLTQFADAVVRAEFGPDQALYLLSRKNAPRGTILRVPLSAPRLDRAEVVVRQSPGTGDDERNRASIASLVPTKTRLYVVDLVGGPSRVRVFDHQGKSLADLPAPAGSSIDGVVALDGDAVLFHASSYLAPSAWYALDANGAAKRTAVSETSPIGFADAEVVREFATSKDGTRVPLNIIRRKGTKLDGTNPVLLEAYGGYGISLTPNFVGDVGRVWLDQGGVYAIANLRGGGEYGEEWHKAGNLTRKQNVFDDFIACAQHLIDRRYTTPARLAILGGSNGGLLMGAAFTQRPDLFRAVVSFVGIYDMLRVELDPNGTFNTTEFGSVKDADQFRALRAYSPYHHVKDGTRYPAILFLTGDNDHRVNPMQSRKMTARLQAANASSHPVYLRTTSSAGHGIGTALNEGIEQSADVFAFLLDQLGIRYARPADPKVPPSSTPQSFRSTTAGSTRPAQRAGR
jgi:prolyl oligopeptidase